MPLSRTFPFIKLLPIFFFTPATPVPFSCSATAVSSNGFETASRPFRGMYPVFGALWRSRVRFLVDARPPYPYFLILLTEKRLCSHSGSRFFSFAPSAFPVFCRQRASSFQVPLSFQFVTFDATLRVPIFTFWEINNQGRCFFSEALLPILLHLPLLNFSILRPDLPFVNSFSTVDGLTFRVWDPPIAPSPDFFQTPLLLFFHKRSTFV